MRSSAQPSPPVGTSFGTENWLYGTAVTYTRAPWTALPEHAVTWNRTVSSFVEPPTTDGEIDWRSTRSRSVSPSSPTGIGPEPCRSQPFAGPGGAGASRITAVGTVARVVRPSAFCAVTRTRIVLPLSTDFSVYVFSLAPLIIEQLPPSASQRFQA